MKTCIQLLALSPTADRMFTDTESKLFILKHLKTKSVLSDTILPEVIGGSLKCVSWLVSQVKIILEELRSTVREKCK